MLMTDGGKLRLLITTSAFSKGADCPNICNVVHLVLPYSLLVSLDEVELHLLYGTPGKHLHTASHEIDYIIYNVVHLVPPSSLVQYIQESGLHLLYGTLEKHFQPAMKLYCINARDCQQNKLFKDFLLYNF